MWGSYLQLVSLGDRLGRAQGLLSQPGYQKKCLWNCALNIFQQKYFPHSFPQLLLWNQSSQPSSRQFKSCAVCFQAFRFWGLRQVGSVLSELWKSSTEQSRLLVLHWGIVVDCVRELADCVCGKHKYLPSVCNYCQTVVFTPVRRCKAGDRAWLAVLAAWLVEAFGLRRTWSQSLLQDEKFLVDQPGFQVPLCWALGEPGLGVIMRLWRSSVHTRPACRQWSHAFIVVWVVSVLKTAQHFPPPEPHSLEQLLMTS